MTIANHQERPNWVNERARCTLSSKFAELLDTVKFDVEEVNRTPSPRRHGQLFKVECKSDSCTLVRRFRENSSNETSGNVTFEIKEREIHIHLPERVTFQIMPKWNEESLSCDLLLDEKPMDLWQISQKALGGFFFEAD